MHRAYIGPKYREPFRMKMVVRKVTEKKQKQRSDKAGCNKMAMTCFRHSNFLFLHFFNNSFFFNLLNKHFAHPKKIFDDQTVIIMRLSKSHQSEKLAYTY